MADVRAWEDVNEDEDEEAMKLQYYGITDIAGITGKVWAGISRTTITPQHSSKDYRCLQCHFALAGDMELRRRSTKSCAALFAGQFCIA